MNEIHTPDMPFPQPQRSLVAEAVPGLSHAEAVLGSSQPISYHSVPSPAIDPPSATSDSRGIFYKASSAGHGPQFFDNYGEICFG